jgi:hypothetical protein
MNSKRYLRSGLLAIIASLVVLGWFVFRHDAAAPPAIGTADQAPTVPASAPGAGPHHTTAAPNLEVPAPATPGAPVKLPPPMQKALDGNPHLAAYYRLEQKVLPSGEEREELHAMLSDPDLIDQVVKDLLTPEFSYTKEGEAKRMVAVEFLGDAATWGDNPAMAKVMEGVEHVVFADNITAYASSELAQSLAGDKAELYTQLLHRSPERAAVITGDARSTPVEPLLAYAKRQYDGSMTAMKADEAKSH